MSAGEGGGGVISGIKKCSERDTVVLMIEIRFEIKKSK